MWPDRVSNPGPLTYESGALPTANSKAVFYMQILISQSFCKSIIILLLMQLDQNQLAKTSQLTDHIYNLFLHKNIHCVSQCIFFAAK